MKHHIIIDISKGNIISNNGFSEHNDELLFQDVSVRIGKNLQVAKDPFSQTVLFYSCRDHYFYASTSWAELISLLQDDDLLINLNYVYDYLQFQCPMTAETLYSGIYCLRSGETLIIDTKGRISSSFSFPNCAQKILFKKTLEDIIANLDIQNSVFHISSGLDSSLLAILASKIHSTSVQLSTCVTRGKGVSDEIRTVERFAQDFHADLTVHDFTDMDVFEKGKSLIDAIGFPIGHPSHLVEFGLDEQCKKDNVITGRGPDETLAGYEWHRECFSDPNKHFKRLRVTNSEILRELLHDFSPPKNKYCFWEAHPILTSQDRLLYDLRTISEAWNIIHAGIGNNFDVSIVSPFMDKRIQAALFGLDESSKIRNGVQKWYLRESFGELYPAYILNAPKKGLRLDLQPYFIDYSYSELFERLYASYEFPQKYISRSMFEKMLTETLDGTMNWGWQIWSIYLCSIACSNR